MAQLDAMERTLKALADRTRLRILHLLGGGVVCVCHIHESLCLPQPTMSLHLVYLRRAGLVLSVIRPICMEAVSSPARSWNALR